MRGGAEVIAQIDAHTDMGTSDSLAVSDGILSRMANDDRFYPGEPNSLAWRIFIAHSATQVFQPGTPHSFVQGVLPPPANTETLGPQRTVLDLLQYLHKRGMTNIWPHALEVQRIVADMARTGYLYDWGRFSTEQGPFGNSYMTFYPRSPLQEGGDLWMSGLFGAELLVPSFGAVAVPIPGTSKVTGDPDIGSGLIVSAKCILTNAHVVNGMNIDTEIPRSRLVPPGNDWGPGSPLRVVKAVAHDSIDVGIIEVEHTALILRPTDAEPDKDAPQFVAAPDKVNSLPDLVFRDPKWSDETYVFGYPPVPMVTEDEIPLVVQRGEVVNPRIHDRYGNQHFLFSATARPGNSGGPVVAQDGRVVGIVAQLSNWKVAGRTKDGPSVDIEAPFYGGVPTNQIVKALDELGYVDQIKVE